MRWTLYLFLLYLPLISFSQDKSKVLLTDQRIQMECLEAIDSMYNFNFEVAEKQYNWLKQQHPEHPLPYFLLGLNEWWKILPNEYVKDYDKTFKAYMDTTIKKAKKLYKKDKANPDATFFLSAAYGFKSRLYAERGSYTAATINAKKSLNYLMESKETNPELESEYMFGISLYNYFREWVPENKKYMKPFLVTFPKGDKELGIQQLEKVASESFYTRIEAMRYLIKIYARYEKKYDKSWDLISYLHSIYPKNAYFTRVYVIIAYHTRHKEECVAACKFALTKVKKKAIGFENETGRVCSFMLGYYCDEEKNHKKAEHYFIECLKFTEMPNAYSSVYTINGLQKLAQYAIDKGDYKTAFYYYSKIKGLSNNKKSESYKEAKKYVKKNKTEFKE
jgi:hypothetical protein